MAKLRVLMISKACIVGIYQRKLEYIAQHDIELMVIVPPSWRDERGEMLLERVHVDGYTLKTLPIRFNGNFHLHFYHQLGRVIRDFQPDIMHIEEEPYNVSTWQALFHAKRVSAKTVVFSWQNILRKYPPPFSIGERWTLSNTDHLLVGTESSGDVWRDKGYTGALSVVPQFGVDHELFVPTERKRQPFTVGYVGRLVEEKGVELLLKAAAQLDFDAKLLLVGGGPMQTSVIELAEELGISDRLNIVGQVDSSRMPALYHNIDVLVLPSLTRTNWKEQFGRVLIEAMASGVPVIGSDSGAIPDVIGEAGIIVSEGDLNQLREAIQRLHDDRQRYDALVIAGRERVVNHFTHAQIADDTVAAYRSLMV